MVFDPVLSLDPMCQNTAVWRYSESRWWVEDSARIVADGQGEKDGDRVATGSKDRGRKEQTWRGGVVLLPVTATRSYFLPQVLIELMWLQGRG